MHTFSVGGRAETQTNQFITCFLVQQNHKLEQPSVCQGLTTQF